MNPTSIHQRACRYVTIAEFCERFGIRRAFYYNLRDAVDGPDELRMGSNKIVITIDSLAAREKKRKEKNKDRRFVTLAGRSLAYGTETAMYIVQVASYGNSAAE